MLHSRIVRIALASAITAAGFGVTKIHAQEVTAAPAQSSSWEFAFTSGKVLPTGAQRDAIKKADLSAAQLSYVMQQRYALIATLGWARSRDITTAREHRLDLFTYDVGAEVRANPLKLGTNSSVRPFAGLGAGGRTYNYRHLDVDATHNAAAYGSLGSEIGVRRVHVRIEARDYVTQFKPLSGAGSSDTRNDVSLLIGVSVASK